MPLKSRSRRVKEAPARDFPSSQSGRGTTRAHATAPKDAALFSEVLARGLADPRLLILASLRADYFDRLQADALFTAYEHVNVPRSRAHNSKTS